MENWTTSEISYLHDHGSDGAESIARELGRSVHAVKAQAKRYGVSLRKSWFCPKCGKEVYKPLSSRTGWCALCSTIKSKEKAEAKRDQLMREIQIEEQKVREVEKERQRVYNDNAKKAKKLRRLAN